MYRDGRHERASGLHENTFSDSSDVKQIAIIFFYIFSSSLSPTFSNKWMFKQAYRYFVVAEKNIAE